MSVRLEDTRWSYLTTEKWASVTSLPQNSTLQKNDRPTYKWRSKGSQHGPQIQPKPAKLKAVAGVGRASDKKHANIKSIQYFLCYKRIQAVPKNLTFH